MKKMMMACCFVLPCLMFGLTGCAHNPNVEMVGSYFPGWMVCLTLGIVMTMLAHALLKRRRAHHAVGHPALIYPAMLVLFTSILWLCLFA